MTGTKGMDLVFEKFRKYFEDGEAAFKSDVDSYPNNFFLLVCVLLHAVFAANGFR
jgi:hypothetical protein